MFIPGCLHRTNAYKTKDTPLFNIKFHYEVKQTTEGLILAMKLTGSIDDKPLNESFQLPKDTAYNFASVVTHILKKHGLSQTNSLILPEHKEYDLIFADIRHKLNSHPGDTVNLDHLKQDY